MQQSLRSVLFASAVQVLAPDITGSAALLGIVPLRRLPYRPHLPSGCLLWWSICPRFDHRCADLAVRSTGNSAPRYTGPDKRRSCPCVRCCHQVECMSQMATAALRGCGYSFAETQAQLPSDSCLSALLRLHRNADHTDTRTVRAFPRSLRASLNQCPRLVDLRSRSSNRKSVWCVRHCGSTSCTYLTTNA
jgi:hypothetical protein